jgi:hypothetical protein
MLDFEDYKSQAEFNGGLAQIYRMDAWEKLSARGLLYDDPKQRYKALVLLFNECYGTDSKTERKREMAKLFFEVEKKMIAFSAQASRRKNVCYTDHPDYYLQRWEMFLREWIQMLGLGMKKASDGTFALAE